MPKTLLLADDSVTIQRVVELAFASEDVRVVSVGDGRRALQWIDAEKPDVVVADVGVPEVDGYRITAHVKESPALRHVPVVLLAGAFEPVDEHRARTVGCDGILVKPFEPQQLVTRVKELLGEAAKWAPRPAAVTPIAAPPLKVVEAEPMDCPVTADGTATVALGPRPVPAMEAPKVPRAELEFNNITPGDPGLSGAAPEPLELPSEPIWHTPLAAGHQEAQAPAPPAKVSLANAFSALLAAEQSRPPQNAQVVAPEIPEAAIEEAVRRILARMTGEAVRQVVLDTAERLIREEIEKIKANHSE